MLKNWHLIQLYNPNGTLARSLPAAWLTLGEALRKARESGWLATVWAAQGGRWVHTGQWVNQQLYFASSMAARSTVGTKGV